MSNLKQKQALHPSSWCSKGLSVQDLNALNEMFYKVVDKGLDPKDDDEVHNACDGLIDRM